MGVTTQNNKSPVRVRKSGTGSAVFEKIAAMLEPYDAMSERLYAIIRESAPSLTPTVWCGMPTYAKDGKVVCFFRGGENVKERYRLRLRRRGGS